MAEKEVASSFKKEKTPWKRERLQVIKLLLETEKSYDEVASIVGRAPNIVKAWAKLFRDGDIATLLVRGNGGGRKPLIFKMSLLKSFVQGLFAQLAKYSTGLKNNINSSMERTASTMCWESSEGT